MDEDKTLEPVSWLSAREKAIGAYSAEIASAYEQGMDDNDELNAKIIDPLVAADVVFTVDVFSKVTVKMKEGGYKAKTINEGDEYYLKAMYVTATNKLILCFEPVDTQDWDFIEIGIKGTDQIFPTFGTALLNSHNIKSEKESAVECIAEVIKLIKTAEPDTTSQMLEDPAFGIF